MLLKNTSPSYQLAIPHQNLQHTSKMDALLLSATLKSLMSSLQIVQIMTQASGVLTLL